MKFKELVAIYVTAFIYPRRLDKGTLEEGG